MKKIIISILLTMAPINALALSYKYVHHSINPNWTVIEREEVFTDDSSCILVGHPEGYLKTSVGPIISTSFVGSRDAAESFAYKRGVSRPYLDGRLIKGFRYRVDKNPSVEISFDYGDDGFISETDDKNMVSAFKAGNTLIYEISTHTRKPELRKISLVGFTKAYDLAKKCDF